MNRSYFFTNKIVPKLSYFRGSLRQIFHINSSSNYGYFQTYSSVSSFPSSFQPSTFIRHQCFHTSPPTLIQTSLSKSDRSRSVKKKMKPCITLTPAARTFFQRMFTQVQADKTQSSASTDPIIGFRLLYQQSHTGQPRMVFSFDFAKSSQLGPLDEGVALYDDSIEMRNGSKAEGRDTTVVDKIKPMLYVHHGALLKVLGCTLDIEFLSDGEFQPVLYDTQGNKLEP